MESVKVKSIVVDSWDTAPRDELSSQTEMLGASGKGDRAKPASALASELFPPNSIFTGQTARVRLFSIAYIPDGG